MNREWNDVYKKQFRATWYPMDGVIRFTARYLKRRIGIELYDIKRDAKRILDVGCGNGNHVVFLAEQGYDVHGIDISEEAIEIATAWVAKQGLHAGLMVGDVEGLPFEAEYFDVVISHGVLDHVPFIKAKKAINEIKRVSREGAYLYLTLRSTWDSEFGRGEEVEKNTFVLQEGYEKGLIQHYFDLEQVIELFEGFRIFDIECHERRFPELYTVDKGFIQSSTGGKKYIDVSKPIDLNLKYSRWHIVAEKV